MASKYHNRKTTYQGIRFDSQKEKDRYQELELLERAGLIRSLELQPRYDFVINGKKLKHYYKADFRNVRPSRKQHGLCRSWSRASMEKEWKAVLHLLSRNTLYCYEIKKAGGSCVEPSPHENFT